MGVVERRDARGMLMRVRNAPVRQVRQAGVGRREGGMGGLEWR